MAKRCSSVVRRLLIQRVKEHNEQLGSWCVLLADKTEIAIYYPSFISVCSILLASDLRVCRCSMSRPLVLHETLPSFRSELPSGARHRLCLLWSLPAV